MDRRKKHIIPLPMQKKEQRKYMDPHKHKYCLSHPVHVLYNDTVS